MSLIAFFKQWSLPLSLLIGVIGYLLFAYVPLLQPIGEVVGPLLESLIPIVLFVLLYVTFCKIQIKEMRPRAWHFWLQTIRVSLSAFFVWLITLTSDPNLRLVLEGMFVCVICPTAAAAPVVTEKLGGSIGSLTVYAIIANVVTSIIIPLFFPMVEKSSDISFATASLMVLRNVTTVLVIPLVLALVSRRVIPRVTDRIKEFRNLGFYLWCFNLTIITGITMRNILHSSLSGTVLAFLLILPLFIALLQFTIGKLVGRYYGDSISAGQALGQKNTVVGIWLTLTFLNPLAAVAPGAYVLWQNMVNASQLWYKQKYGRLKW